MKETEEDCSWRRPPLLTPTEQEVVSDVPQTESCMAAAICSGDLLAGTVASREDWTTRLTWTEEVVSEVAAWVRLEVRSETERPELASGERRRDVVVA